MKRIVILISGRGSNLRAILKAKLHATVCEVISNNAAAAGLQLAREAGIATRVISHRDYADRASFDRALGEAIAPLQPDLIVLAGFMRILGDAFISRFSGRIMNIHPSLLPAFPGLHTHRRALDEGVKLHGCTVHFVTAALDHGPIIIQAAVPVFPDDDEERLAQRVLEQEHLVYPRAIRWFLCGQLAVEGNRVRISAPDAPATSVVSPAPC